jgi:hypothetical protein
MQTKKGRTISDPALTLLPLTPAYRRQASPLPIGGCAVIVNKKGEAFRFQSFRMRVF